MEIYANAKITSWQGATRVQVLTVAPIAGVDATRLSAAGFGQPKTMRNHKFTTRSGFPPRGRFR